MPNVMSGVLSGSYSISQAAAGIAHGKDPNPELEAAPAPPAGWGGSELSCETTGPLDELKGLRWARETWSGNEQKVVMESGNERRMGLASKLGGASGPFTQ